MSPAGNTSRSIKRMRLGTRSCAECRRRKVRCNFPENQSICEECKAHGTTCQSQQASLERKSRQQDPAESDIRQRLETLERLFAQVHKSLEAGNNGSASPDSLRQNVAQALGLSAASPSQLSSQLTSDNSGDFDQDGSEIASVQGPGLGMNAPLMKLFKDAMVMEPSSQMSTARLFHGGQRVVAAHSRLRYVLPDEFLLDNILRASVPYWFLWPLPPGTGPDPVADASVRIQQGLKSRNPTSFARSLLWLTLCTLQLVGENRRLIAGLQASQGELAERFYNEASDALPFNFEPDEMREGLECLLLQAKICVDLGRPHKVWHFAGMATKLGLLLGLDKLTHADAHGRTLFQKAWQQERIMSSMVGLPPSLSELDPALSVEHTSDVWRARAMRRLSIVAGHIAERDRLGAFRDYATTERIEYELQQIYSGVPADAWLHLQPQGRPVQEAFVQHHFELMFYCHRKNLHLPFLFEAEKDPRYAVSRVIALDSARRICQTVRDLRQRISGWLMACDLADFQIFTGAATLALGLLRPVVPNEHRDEEADWQLVDSVTAHLRQNFRLVQCTVAGQAAELLEHLSMARHGFLPVDEEYSAVIPFFGRFRIKRRLDTAQSTNGLAVLGHGEKEMAQLDYGFGNSVEFYSDVLAGIDARYLGPDALVDADFGADWLVGVDFDPGTDWVQLLGQSGGF